MDELVQQAIAARENAHAPYSKFRVGAALRDDNGRIFTGCNVENATYGLTMCAERVAVFKAISEGARRFTRVAVVADTDTLTPPCGACRQILWEFCGDVELVLANLHGKTETLHLTELFPRAFDASFL
ncbi:MAG: cytidine deaminase [Acidobacteriota bacterium]|nr:cytidine deaminase [Acidobacteriota bacterium]